MEALEPLSIESFSYSWLVNPKGSFRASFDMLSDESNFIEMDPKLSPSKRFLVFHQDFDFDLPTLQPSVHADELILNGTLVPFFLKRLEHESDDSCSNSTPASPMGAGVLTGEKACLYRRSQSLPFRRYKRLPKRVVRKYLSLVRLVWLRMRRRRCDINETPRAKNWEKCSVMSSPRRSEAYGGDNWRRSCDSESSIYEAVLHCKKTIGCE